MIISLMGGFLSGGLFSCSPKFNTSNKEKAVGKLLPVLSLDNNI